MGVIFKTAKNMKGNEIIIRTAEIDDGVEMLELLNKIDYDNRYMIRKPGELDKSIDEMKGDIDKAYKSANSLWAVAEVNNVIAGHIKFEGKNKLRLKHKGEFTVGVSKEHWGKGIGSLLMEAMLQWCSTAGIVKVELKVAEENTRGIDLYRRYGFKIVGRLEKDMRLENGEYLDFLLMDKLI